MTRAAKRTSSPEAAGLFGDVPTDPAPILTFDEARRAYPEIGVAIYAIEPGSLVTVEVHSAGEVYAFIGPTAEDAMALAFPPEVPGDVFG